MRTFRTAIALLPLALVACGGGDSVLDVVVVDETKTLGEGVQITYSLPVGTYKADIASSNNGVAIAWVGGSGCQSAAEVKSYSSSCSITSVGLLTILNPTLLGLGGAEVVAIKVTRQ
jgi:hypothetical protein